MGTRGHRLRHVIVTLLLTAATTASARPVDVVVCLDTSRSMEGLIDSARSRLWDIVTTLSKVEPRPELRVGLLSYGSPTGSSEEDGWVIVRTDLTSDLDHVYAQLMGLATDGGDELVGRVVHEAVNTMSWAPDPEGLRLVFVAGNESADQGVDTYDFRAATELGRRADVVVNAIFVGSRDIAVTSHWDELARAGRGSFSSIDPELGRIQVETPQDEALLTLNASLNETYLPYGPDGAAGLANQTAQDGNATRLGVQSCSSRIVAKGTALYTNASWDLVDALQEDGFQWASLTDDDLPPALRGMSIEAREAHVAALRERRESIQEKIQDLSNEREEFLRAELKRRQLAQPGLDDALRDALLAQARKKGFNTDGC
ncbi:MAG: hypothetical protein AAF533_01660 [Acidobacteriota bacterium]